MPELIITTIGEVAFSNTMKLSEGYRYDVPFDNLMLPYMPIAGILRNKGLIDGNTQIGFAHPEGYRGYVYFARELLKNRNAFGSYIKKYFTIVHLEKADGSRIRSLRSGMTFRAAVHVPESKTEELKNKLSGRIRIGITTEEISGEVELRFSENDTTKTNETIFPFMGDYVSLDYSAMLLTPACFDAPFSDKDRTYPYIPGPEIKSIVRSLLSDGTEKEWDNIICTNAYIGFDNRRLLPVPACISVVKLDKSKMRYRLSKGRDPKLLEQDTELTDCFASDFQGNLLTYTAPETEHILSENGEMYDALTSGQVFYGRIYGKHDMIQKLASGISLKPLLFAGTLSKEGYGEIYLNITGVNESEVPVEFPVKAFDFVCISDVLLLGDDGMPSCKAEDLLKEIESVLNCPGKLMTEGQYINISKDYSVNRNWNLDNPVVRCIAKGSVIRVKTKDDEPVDIFPLRNCFLGERTKDGYGEVMAYPAVDRYYRLAESVSPPLYEITYPLSREEEMLGKAFKESVSLAVLRNRIKALAFADYEEWKAGIPMETLLPMDLLLLMRNQFAPTMPEEKLVLWYTEELEAYDEGNSN